MSDTLSDTKHGAILQKIIKEKLGSIEPVTSPRLFMLGGQPGAGKSNVRRAIVESRQGKGSLIIDPDDLRTYHPQYVQFVKENPDTAAGRVHPDAAKWAAELRTAAISKRVNIIFDGTLGGNPKASTGMAKEAARAGYQVELHVVAVALETSEQGVRGRYENAFVEYAEDPDNTAPPRNVPENIQRGSYNKIPDVIESLAATGVVSRMRIADRSGKKLSDISNKFAVKKDAGQSAVKALKEERNRPWTVKEIESYDKNGRDIEALLQHRIDGAESGEDQERLEKELDELREKRLDVVETKNEVLDSLRPARDQWIRKTTKFSFPRKKR